MSNQITSYQLTHVLCEYGLLTIEQAHEVEQMAAKLDIPIVSCLVRNHFVSSDQIFEICRQHFKMPTADLSAYDANLLHDETINLALIDRYHILPLQKDPYSLHIAVSDPTDHASITAISFHTGLRIHLLLAKEHELDRIIHTHCRPNILYSELKSALARLDNRYQDQQRDDEQQNDEPVIHFVNQLLNDAANKQVSDIHIETFSTYCRIRFRLDGLLYETATLPQTFSSRIITRLKIMANLDIAEKRLPQDGRFMFQHNTDIRISTCPALHGENAVLRILRHASQQLPLAELGMNTQQLSDFQHALQKPQGLILVTGPTGSGKTATLYSALQILNQADKNILTVEDPVEIELPGVTQVNVNAKIKLDFAAILRSFLRQDPDIIMVGEIRDPETAAIAVQAAQTGHLVLSTLHSNNAVDAIKRLLSLHISPCQLAGALTLIAAQRLARKLCTRCQSKQGCEYCQHGYHGRTGIFEVLPVTAPVTQLLLASADLAAIEQQFMHENFTTMAQSGAHKVESGVTSQSELARVLGV